MKLSIEYPGIKIVVCGARTAAEAVGFSREGTDFTATVAGTVIRGCFGVVRGLLMEETVKYFGIGAGLAAMLGCDGPAEPVDVPAAGMALLIIFLEDEIWRINNPLHQIKK